MGVRDKGRGGGGRAGGTREEDPLIFPKNFTPKNVYRILLVDIFSFTLGC